MTAVALRTVPVAACAARLRTSRSTPQRSHPCRLWLVPAPETEQAQSERELCERARAGDRQALGDLLRQYGPRLFRSVLLPRLGSVALAEEALGVTYVKVVEHFGQFSWQSVGVYPWLRVVALRVALDQLRARRRETLFEPADLEREIDAGEQQDEEAKLLEQQDLSRARDRVERLLGRIHPRYAEAIRLRVLQERSREEAANTIGVTVATFDVVLHRAMAAVRKAMSAERAAA
ncbi:MAG: RNA polymerase sigma factor [Polyangiaceae bacterium]|nr:RNA polymerase sigma factor [Polyangiaceae bacterium]